MKKYILYTLLIIVIIVIGFLSYLKFMLPDIKTDNTIKIEITKERIARGKYLATTVIGCIACHSERDFNKFAGPVVPNTYGEGGEEFSQKLGLPGNYVAKNITPYGIGDWTDGQLLRAITEGVSKDGKALFPIMPYLNFGKMDREDVYSIIAYIRTLPAIKKDNPKSSTYFPMNFIMNTIPAKAIFSTIPDSTNKVMYGKYLLNSSACNDCHTLKHHGKSIKGMEMAGGFAFPMPTGGTVFSANITPDKETGIGNWTEDAFVARFKAYADSNYKPYEVHIGDFNTMMPWQVFAYMKTGDIKAIFAYLQTIKPVKNKVKTFENNK